MPELPEVEIVRQSLDKKIKQKKVEKVIVRNRNLRFVLNLIYSSLSNCFFHLVLEIHLVIPFRKTVARFLANSR